MCAVSRDGLPRNVPMRFAGEVTFLMTSSSFSIICAGFGDRFFVPRNFRAQCEQFLADRIPDWNGSEDAIEGLEQTYLEFSGLALEVAKFVAVFVTHRCPRSFPAFRL